MKNMNRETAYIILTTGGLQGLTIILNVALLVISSVTLYNINGSTPTTSTQIPPFNAYRISEQPFTKSSVATMWSASVSFDGSIPFAIGIAESFAKHYKIENAKSYKLYNPNLASKKSTDSSIPLYVYDYGMSFNRFGTRGDMIYTEWASYPYSEQVRCSLAFMTNFPSYFSRSDTGYLSLKTQQQTNKTVDELIAIFNAAAMQVYVANGGNMLHTIEAVGDPKRLWSPDDYAILSRLNGVNAHFVLSPNPLQNHSFFGSLYDTIMSDIVS